MVCDEKCGMFPVSGRDLARLGRLIAVCVCVVVGGGRCWTRPGSRGPTCWM
jgi:hypothetical protein